MWLPNSDELKYFKHYERDLIDDVTRQRLQARYRVFAARNPKKKLNRSAYLAQALRFVVTHL